MPLAPNEERYVLSEALSSENYGNPWAIRIKGRLDHARLRDAIQRMCDRHEGRRTGYEPGPDGRFTRFVEAKGRPEIRFVRMIGAPQADVRRAIRNWFFERGDLNPPSFSRYLVIQTADDEHMLGHYLHHAVNDAETQRAATAEIIDNYAGREPAAPAVAYSDLWNGDWRSSPAYLAGEAFWRGFLGDVEAVGELPADGGDPPGGDWTGPARLRLPPDLVAAAARAAETAGVSEFTFHYAVTQVLLTRLTGVDRVCSTFQSGGRRSVPGSEGVHGVFSNGLVLATRVDERESIAVLAGRLRGEIRQALAHEAYPYHHVIQASGLRPRFGINWFPDIALPECPGLEISQPDMDFGNWEYDFNIRFVRHLASGALDLIIYFREPTISRARAVLAAEQYARLLAAFAADVEAPVGAVRSADLVPAGALPDPTQALPADAGELIHARFLDHARRTPQAVAIRFGDERHTYGDLERRSRALAQTLAAGGVGPGDRVAILAERGPALVWSMLAAARLGAVFVVLDSAYPERRLERLLGMSGAQAIVRAGGEAAAETARRLAQARGLAVFDAETANDAADAELAPLDADTVGRPAYYLFTSGSTGEPKGVACSHGPLAHFVDWQARTYGLGADDRFTMLSGLSHDPVLRDIFTPLSLGATLMIPRQEQITEPGALGRWLRRSGATVIHATPALGQLMTAGARPEALPALRRIFWGGDLLPPALVREVAALAPAARQVNFYGSTETPQAAAAFDCDQELDRVSVPIGRGVEGCQLLVVDRSGAQVGPGELGEIAVRSAYPALGYLSDGGIAPFASRGPADGAGVYYTGDRGFTLPSGAVLMLGRADDQVKVRGHRVELSEISAALTAHPAVRTAIVLPLGEGGSTRLAAFVTGRRRRTPRAAELTQHLAGRLPHYMLPGVIHVLDSLPLLANGKADRDALRALCAAAQPAGAEPRSGTAREQALMAAWEQVLGEPGLTRDSSFASHGGDSLSYVQMYLATEEVIGVVPSGWQLMSIAELAQHDRAASRLWSVVDTPMLIRAISIFLVVVGHMHVIRYGGGATTGLLVVSGYLFGGLQLREVFKRGSAEPVLKGLRKLLAPVLLFCVTLFAAKALAGKAPDLSVPTFLDNFQDYSRLAPPRYGGHEFYLWYIDCLLQMLGLLYLAVLGWTRLGGIALGQRGFTVGLFLVACVTRFLAPALFIPDFLIHGARRLTMVSFLPTTHLATFLLGALIAEAETRRQKAWVLAALVAYAAATWPIYGLQQASVVLGGGLAILFVKRIVLPKPLTFVVLLLSGASLFIYLTEFIPRMGLQALHGPRWPALDAAAGLAFGVAVWWGWTWLTAQLARRTRGAETAEPQPAL